MSVLHHHTPSPRSLLIWLIIMTSPCHILGLTTAGYCPAGSFQDLESGVCSLCPAGSYQALAQQSTCTPCPAESTTKTGGATSVSLCTGEQRVTCDAEHPLWKRYAFWLRLALSWTSDLQHNSSAAYALLWSKLTTPVNTSLQTLASYRGSLQLVAFAPGSVLVYMEATLFTSSNTLADLTAVIGALVSKGTVGNISIDTSAGIDSAYGVAYKGNLECTQGQYFSYSTGACVYCDVTSYQPVGVSDVCFSCAQGYSTGQQGTVGDSSSCLFVCARGWQQVPGLAVCQQCPTGTYKSQEGPLACTSCPAGFTTSTTGSILPANCTVSVSAGCSATLCDLGYQCRWDSTQTKAVCYCPGVITDNQCTANNQTSINTTLVIIAAITAGVALTIVIIIVTTVLCVRRRKKSQLTHDKDNVQFLRVNGKIAQQQTVAVRKADKSPLAALPTDISSAEHKAASVQTSDANSHVTATVQTNLLAPGQSQTTFSSTIFSPVSPGALFYDESVGISFDEDDDSQQPIKTPQNVSNNSPLSKTKAELKPKKASKFKLKKSNSSRDKGTKPSHAQPPIGPANDHVTKPPQVVEQPFDPPTQMTRPKQTTVVAPPSQPKQSAAPQPIRQSQGVEPVMIDRPPQHVIDAHNNRVRMTQSLRMYNPQLIVAQPTAMGYPIQQYPADFANSAAIAPMQGYPIDGHMHHFAPMEFAMDFPMDMFPQPHDAGRRRRHQDSAQRRRHHYPSERRAHHRPWTGDGHASKRHRPMKRNTRVPPPESNTYESIDPDDVTDPQPIASNNFILKSLDQPIGNQPDVEQSPYESIPADSTI